MWTDSDAIVVGLSILVPLIGLCGVIAARLRSAGQKKCDWIVLVCFAIVGTTCVLLMQQFNGSWLAVATTMPLMAVGATLDLKKTTSATAF